MAKDTVTGKPTWFTVSKINHYLGRVGTPGVDNYMVNSRTVDRLNNDSRWGGDFPTREDAIAYGEAQGWTLVRSFKEAKEQARPILDAKWAAFDRQREARKGLVEVRIGDHARYVSQEIALVLMELFGNFDEYGVVRELGITSSYWNLPEPVLPEE